MASITVVKIGGSTLGEHDTCLDDVAALHAAGHAIVVVHGGGAVVSEWLDRHGVESRFKHGLRVTDAAALDVVVAVLAGLVNKRLVAELVERGAIAIGISGADASILQAQRFDDELGHVGQISAVDPAPIEAIIAQGSLAVVAPIAIEAAGGRRTSQLLNVNADTAAGCLASTLKAESLIFLTDVPGIISETNDVIPRVSEAEARDLAAGGTVSGGMLPKLEAAMKAAAAGVSTIITDGRRPGALREAVGGTHTGTVIAAQ
jgi:acetylglutamate kinase